MEKPSKITIYLIKMLQLLGDFVLSPPIEVLSLDPGGDFRHQTLSSRSLNSRAMAAPVANLDLE